MKIEFLVEGRCFNVPAGYEDQFAAILAKAEADGMGYLLVTVQPRPVPRTEIQNRKFHDTCGLIARAMRKGGLEISKEQVKEYVKSRAVEFGYPFMLDADGKPVVVNGNFLGKSVADSTMDECGILIDAAYYVASENEIHLER